MFQNGQIEPQAGFNLAWGDKPKLYKSAVSEPSISCPMA